MKLIKTFVLCKTQYTTDYPVEIDGSIPAEDQIPEGWVQLSEAFSVDITMLPAEVVNKELLGQIEAEERVLRGKFQHELDKLAERRDSLLAISHNGESDDR